jgi:CubicO group peptidase (beta-lactamase class C family)
MKEFIEIKGARINNLKNINIRIPQNKLTVITGVSGSGKSSLAFDTLFEEGKRRYLLFSGAQFMVDSKQHFENMDSSILNQIDDYIKRKRYRLVNSILILKNGRIVFEKYYNRFNENSRNNIKSIWKSILSIVTGICLDKGLIKSIDEPIREYLPEFARNLHPYHKLITIRHLLTMSSGIYWNGGIHYHCPMMSQMMRTNDWTAHIADIAMDSVPGTKFEYKEWDVMLLSALIGKACRGTAYDIAKEYLYAPLNIKSDEWPKSPCGFSYTVMKGEENSDLSARDLAKIGLLFLSNGSIDGKTIISSDFVRRATTPSFINVSIGSSTGNYSYGYLWWLFPGKYVCRGWRSGSKCNTR